MRSPAITVAVASRDRPVRLRWLLNALSEQRISGGELEVVVAHDPACQETVRVLGEHSLCTSGKLHRVEFPAGSGFPGAGRNAAWRVARAPLVLFTDDDCRPSPDWVQAALSRAEGLPGAVLQGQTVPDPDEAAVLQGAPWARTMRVFPPTAWAQTCNICYPRELLEQVGGFDERMRVGEDAEIAQRALGAGARIVAVPEMVVYHAVQALSLLGALRGIARWRDIAWLAKRHPQVRRHMWGRIWWKREHAAFTAALAGALAMRQHRSAAMLALPWLVLSMGHRGCNPRGIMRSLSELPGRAAIDAAEIITMVRGSFRYRTLLL